MWTTDQVADNDQTQSESEVGYPVNTRKRRRVTQACEPCRRKKSKCNGAQPCSICETTGRNCHYGSINKRRGLPAGYVRGLEILLGSALKNNCALENDLRVALREDFDDVRFTEGDAAESLLEIWRKCKAAKDVEILLSSCQDQEPKDESHVENTRKLAPIKILPALPIPQACERVSESASRITPTADELLLPNEDSELHKSSQHELNVQQSQLPQDLQTTYGSNMTTIQTLTIYEAVDLIDFYFAYTHCWLPMLDKSVLLRTLYSEKWSHNGRIGTSENMVVIWALLAYVSTQMPILTASTSIKTQPEYMYNVARSLIPTEEQEYQLRHAQALLLLAMVKLGSDTPSKAWMLLGQAARMLEILTQRESQTSHEMEQTTLTLKCCALLDTITAALIDKAPYFTVEELSTTNLLEEDGLDEWSVWRPPAVHSGINQMQSHELIRSLSVFNNVFRLVTILGKILRASSTYPLETKITELQAWGRSLPQHCRLRNNRACTPAVLHLHMLWICTISSLQHRLQNDACSELVADLQPEEFADHIMVFLQRSIDDFGIANLPKLFVSYLTYILRLAPSTIVAQLSQKKYEALCARLNHIKDMLLIPQPSPLTKGYIFNKHNQAPRLATHAGHVGTAPARANQLAGPELTTAPSWLPKKPVDLFDPTFSLENNTSTHKESNFTTLPEIEEVGTPVLGDFEGLLYEIDLAKSSTSILDADFMQNLGFAPDTDAHDLLSFLHPEPQSSHG